MKTNKVCLVCGYQLEDSFNYCPHCSARVSQEQTTDEYVHNITRVAEEISLRKRAVSDEMTEAEAIEIFEAYRELPETSADKK